MYTHNYQQIINKFAEVLSRMGTAQAEGYVDYIIFTPLLLEINTLGVGVGGSVKPSHQSHLKILCLYSHPLPC